MLLKRFLITLFILLNYISYSQSDNNIKYWIDINGKSISETLFLKQLRTQNSEFAIWKYIAKDSGYVAKAHYKFNLYAINHSFFLNYINRITNKKFPSNTTLLIEFHYKDDLCGSNHSNKWNGLRIKNRKNYTDKWRKSVESKNKNLAYLVFYEKDILLQNSNSKNEYYFSDVEGLFRKNIFLNPTSCGSYMLSKPDGKTLVRNGESNAEIMAGNLDSKKWDNLVFD